MKKVRANLLMLVLGLALVLIGAQAAGAYEFTYLGIGFVASAQVPGDGPYVNFGDTYAGADAMGEYMYASGFGDWWSNTPNSIGVEVRGQTAVTSFDPGDNGSTSASAVTKAETGGNTGVYFKINGGTPGEEVSIHYSWSANVETMAGGTATLGGGSNNMYISVNEYPTDIPTNPVWQMDQIIRGSNELENFSDSGTFMAHVGDIIGINLAAFANVDFSGEGDYYAWAYNSMELEVVPLPPAVWLLGSGLLGLLALGGLRPRRR